MKKLLCFFFRLGQSEPKEYMKFISPNCFFFVLEREQKKKKQSGEIKQCHHHHHHPKK
jgi:hypothetical protein